MGSARRKGNRLEKLTGKWLQQVDEPCEEFGNITSSTWRVGHYPNLQIDVVSKRIAAECKSRKKLPKYIIEAFEQIIEEADKVDKAALLVLKANYKPVLHCITQERHAELLEYERKCLDGGD
jgi:hypothetical protein